MTGELEMSDAFETIALYGLTEGPDCLPIPEDHVLSDQTVREAFDALLAPLGETGLAPEIEPLAHGLASLLHRRRNAVDDTLSRQVDALRALSRSQDGSEIHMTQTEDTQARATRLLEVRDALGVMAEAAARCYEVETGRAFIPSSKGRTNTKAHLTGAVFEAKQWLEEHERQNAQQFVVHGTPLAIAGDRDWTDHGKIFDTLDKIQTRFFDLYGEPLIIYHKGDKWGVDAIAAAWAKARKVAQVVFQPNWRAYGKSAGFKAIDQMLDTPKPLGGVAIFGAAGIALNLADKAEAKGIKAMRVTATPAKTEI
jgi:regulator of protease activity HflC (stomatin/prohibitin superfamily)